MFTFFVPATPTSALYPLSLHDALPILPVLPGVAREPPLAGLRLGRRRVVAERRRYDRSSAREQALRMARRLGLRHREAHVGEESARTPLTDVALGVLIRGGWGGADDVEAELVREGRELCGGHARIVPVKAVRIHEDGGPEVLRYEDAPDPR